MCVTCMRVIFRHVNITRWARNAIVAPRDITVSQQEAPVKTVKDALALLPSNPTILVLAVNWMILLILTVVTFAHNVPKDTLGIIAKGEFVLFYIIIYLYIIFYFLFFKYTKF